jgi:hypothetical protein
MDALRTRRCECGGADCTAVVQITWAEQDEVDHADTVLWIVAPGHEPQGGQSRHVVKETARYVVVEAEEADS